MTRRSSVDSLSAASFLRAFDYMNSKTASKSWLAQALSPANAGDFKNAAGAVFVVFRGAELFGRPFNGRAIELHIRPDWQWLLFVGERLFDAATVLAKFVDLRSLTALTLAEHVPEVLDAADTFVSTLVRCARVLAATGKSDERNESLRYAIEHWTNTARAVSNPDAVQKHGQPLTHIKGALCMFCRRWL
jgi:hypothetical protein